MASLKKGALLFSAVRFSGIVAAGALTFGVGISGASAESMSSGPGYVQYSGNIDYTLNPGGLNPPDHTNYDDSTTTDGIDYFVPLSQFDSSLGALTKVTLDGEIDVTYSYNLTNQNSTQDWNYSYSYDIEIDAPYVSPGASWVQAVNTATGTVSPNGTYSVGPVALTPSNSTDLTSSAALAAFTGPGTVQFNILDADDGVDDAGASGNGIENYAFTWTGNVSVRYDYAVVPLPAAAWGGMSLLGLLALVSARRYSVKY